jgi:hypothetical protein
VECHEELGGGADNLEESFPKMRKKWWTTIRDDVIGQPWRRTAFARMRFVVAALEMTLEQGIKFAILVNLSTTTKMESCPP